MQDNGDYLKTQSVMHLALVIGAGLFMIIAIGLKHFGLYPSVFPSNDIITIVLIAALSVTTAIGRFLTMYQLQAAHSVISLEQKLNSYKAVMIRQYALIEGPLLFCVVWYLLSASSWMIYAYLVIFFIFLSVRPSRSRVQNDLTLNVDEINSLGPSLYSF